MHFADLIGFIAIVKPAQTNQWEWNARCKRVVGENDRFFFSHFYLIWMAINNNSSNNNKTFGSHVSSHWNEVSIKNQRKKTLINISFNFAATFERTFIWIRHAWKPNIQLICSLDFDSIQQINLCTNKKKTSSEKEMFEFETGMCNTTTRLLLWVTNLHDATRTGGFNRCWTGCFRH